MSSKLLKANIIITDNFLCVVDFFIVTVLMAIYQNL